MDLHHRHSRRLVQLGYALFFLAFVSAVVAPGVCLFVDYSMGRAAKLMDSSQESSSNRKVETLRGLGVPEEVVRSYIDTGKLPLDEYRKLDPQTQEAIVERFAFEDRLQDGFGPTRWLVRGIMAVFLAWAVGAVLCCVLAGLHLTSRGAEADVLPHRGRLVVLGILLFAVALSSVCIALATGYGADKVILRSHAIFEKGNDTSESARADEAVEQVRDGETRSPGVNWFKVWTRLGIGVFLLLAAAAVTCVTAAGVHLVTNGGRTE